MKHASCAAIARVLPQRWAGTPCSLAGSRLAAALGLLSGMYEEACRPSVTAGFPGASWHESYGMRSLPFHLKAHRESQ